jgi:putative transcriptional regulator
MKDHDAYLPTPKKIAMIDDPLTQDPLALDHSAGALDAAGSLVLNTRLRLAAEYGAVRQLADVVGGALLERIEPVALGALPLVIGSDGRRPCLDGVPEARAIRLSQLAQTDPDALAWRWRWFGVREHSLPVPGARLLMMKAGAAAPRHTHHSFELTLVLSGRYGDEKALYAPGDLALVGPGETHRPHTLSDSGCLCLTAVVGESAIQSMRNRVKSADAACPQ